MMVISDTYGDCWCCGGVEFVTIEASLNGDVVAIGIAGVGNSDVVMFMAMNVDNEADFSLLTKLAPIAKSAQRKSSSNNITIDIHPDMDSLMKLGED